MTRLLNRSIDVRLTHAGMETQGKLFLGLWTPWHAFKRSAFCLVAIYLAGTFADLNPFIHFFLPPLWILIGPWVAKKVYRAYSGSFELGAGEGRCPQCKQSINFYAYENRFPVSTICKLCATSLIVQPTNEGDLDNAKQQLTQEGAALTEAVIAKLPAPLRSKEKIKIALGTAFHLSFLGFTALTFLMFAYAGHTWFSTAVPTVISLSTSSHAPNTLLQLFMAIVVIVGVAKLLGAVFEKFHQPAVMGEVVAGILLGPSLLGMLSPATMTFIFPPAIHSAIGILAQLGIVLFMFLVGVGLDTNALKTRAHASVAISHASIIVPFLAGSFLALFLFPFYAPPDTSFTVFSMFIGVAMSITAFPVLARILKDLHVDKTPLGLVTLTCASIDDVTAWSLLALVIGLAKADLTHAAITFGGTLLFVFIVMFFGKHVSKRLVDWVHVKGVSANVFSLVCVIVIVAAMVTEWIGIHALFGAFLIGVVIPHDSILAEKITDNLNHFILTILLPAFFAYTGLRTHIGLVDSFGSWALCGVVILMASLGKIGGAAVAAKFSGFSLRESFAIGTLMNTRGLMELVVLNVGLDLGILSPPLFAMMVIMALVTTFMTTPLYLWIMKAKPHTLRTSAA